MKRPATILIALSLLPFFLQAQKWSLQRCVDTAVKNNLDILKEYNNLHAALLDYQQRRWTMYPSLNGTASQNFNFGRSLDQSTFQFNDRRAATNSFSLNSGMVLYNGGQVKNTIRQGRLVLDAAGYDLQQLKDQVSLDVVNAFITVLFANESVRNAQLQMESTQELVRQTEIFVQAGKKAESDLAQMKAQIANEQYDLVAARGYLRTASLHLQQLMEIAYDDRFSIELPLLPEADLNALPPATEVYQLALQMQPSVKSSELQKQIEQLGLKITRAGLYPKLSLNAGLNSSYSSLSSLSKITTVSTLETVGFLKDDRNQEVVNYIERKLYTPRSYPFFSQLSDRFNQSISLNLSIPIFNGRQVRYAISQQEVNIRRAELNERINKNDLRKAVEQATVEAENAQMKYASAKEAWQAEQVTYENLQLLFEASKSTAVDLLVEKNKLAVAASQWLQAKYELVLRLKVLDYYEGKPLNLR